MKKLWLIMIVLLMAMTLTACSGNELVGVWQGRFDGTMFELSLEKDGVGGVKKDGRSYLGTWEAADGKLTVVSDEAEGKLTVIDGAEYSINGNTLTITIEGREITLTKQQEN